MIQEVAKRDGRTVPFDARKIELAVRECLRAQWDERRVAGGDHWRPAVLVAQQAENVLLGRCDGTCTVEQVQDAVEVAMLASGLRTEARAYMAYRDEKTRLRAAAPVPEVRAEVPPDGWGDFAHRIYSERYSLGGSETWPQTARRVAQAVFSVVMHLPGVAELTQEAEQLIAERKFMPGGRYLYSAGRDLHQCQNCLMTMVEDSREGWAEHFSNHTMGLSTGAGMGTVYSKLRPKGARLVRTGGVASGPIPLAVATNEVGRGLRQGGDRRSALWGGLHWWHADAPAFIRLKNWAPEVRAMKAANWESPAPMDQTNISLCLDDEFFEAYHTPGYCRKDPLHGDVTHERARGVFWDTLRNALETGDPGFSVDVGPNAGEWLRNACTELTTYDDSDICNIGSLNIARIESLVEFQRAVEVSTAFLLAGTIYSHVPYEKVAAVRQKNRRLGLGLMGTHEWLLKRGRAYGPDEQLGAWLDFYAMSTKIAGGYADAWGVSRPVKTRAMAPNGTIGIVAETTTGIEPLLCAAYKRRVKKGDHTYAQYVVDPMTRRLVADGVAPESIETAYSLAETREGIERRVAFQAWFQRYVDHGIASTINLPAWGSETNNESSVQWFGEMLLRYLPILRGITMYPDGSRGGQPITQVPYAEALARGNELSYETGDVCDLRGGSCGS